jgi:hypothetical protein
MGFRCSGKIVPYGLVLCQVKYCQNRTQAQCHRPTIREDSFFSLLADMLQYSSVHRRLKGGLRVSQTSG